MNKTFIMKKAFTLIELLVVIAIIAILATILIPSISAAKELARTVACKSNLRNMTLGIRMYSQENESWLPTAEPPNREFPDQRHWFMNKDLLDNMNATLLETPKGGTPIICPSHQKPFQWRDGTLIPYGLSYGMNGTWGLGGRPDHLYQRRMDEFEQECKVMVFSDACGIDTAPGIVLYKSCPKANFDFRHRDKVNLSFLDGHIGNKLFEQIPFGMQNRFEPFWSTRKP